MTGPTHRQYSVCFGAIALMLIYRLGITEINYYLAMPIILTTSRFGAQFPDFDHEWQNVGDKTVVKRLINILIHLTGGKHRSWQTHSADICTLFTLSAYFVPNMLCNLNKISTVNKEVIILLLLGFSSGWISHLFSDMLNGTGIRLFCFIKQTIALVPKKIGKLRFNTGNEWEAFNFKVIKKVNIVIGTLCLIYPLFIEGKIQYLLNILFHM